MIVLGFGLVIALIFVYFLGYIPGTLYYTRKRFVRLASYIKYLANTEENVKPDCQNITYQYYILVGLAKKLLVDHGIDIHQNYYLSYIFQEVVDLVQRTCSSAMECKSLNFDDIKCDNEDLKTFQKYFMKNIKDEHGQNIEFHDIEKNHKKFTYPCSINVYDDFYTNGYMFDINNVKKDGMCQREITGYIRK